MNETVWIAIDIGCLCCGVDSVILGIFETREEAAHAADSVDAGRAEPGWRDGGQSNTAILRYPRSGDE